MKSEEMLRKQILHALKPKSKGPLDLVDDRGLNLNDHCERLLTAFRVGGVGSMNHLRLALAALSRWEPFTAADAWVTLLAAEIGAKSLTEGETEFRYASPHSFEVNSRTYWGWNVIGAWVGWEFLVRALDEGRVTTEEGKRIVHRAIALLRRDLGSAVVFMAATMIPRYRLKTGNGRVEYAGPHTVTGGIRSLQSSHLNPEINGLMATLLSMEHLNRKSFFYQEVVGQLRPPFDVGFRSKCRNLILQGDPTVLKDGSLRVRPMVPFEIRRYRNHLAVVMEEMAGGLTGSTFGGFAPLRATPSEVQYLYPYPAGVKVRSGNPWLGRGAAWFDDEEGEMVALNKAPGEDGPAMRSSIKGLPGDEEMIWSLRADREVGVVLRLRDSQTPAPPPPDPEPTPEPERRSCGILGFLKGLFD